MESNPERAVHQPRLAPPVAQALLGYVNFSDGRPDPRWQRQLDDAFAAHGPALLGELQSALDALHTGGGAAFRDITQARAVLDGTARTLDAYAAHHRDLLAHLGDDERLNGFFLARVIEAVLRARAADTDDALERLNDFLGHRPLAVLETRPRGEPYEHERHRP